MARSTVLNRLGWCRGSGLDWSLRGGGSAVQVRIDLSARWNTSRMSCSLPTLASVPQLCFLAPHNKCWPICLKFIFYLFL